ncbi:MAG: MFS transporter [Chloroflexota bacterium]|nr:MFS transporter [Chloroflexota bacterium]
MHAAPAPDIERDRTRALVTYFTAAALASIAYIAAWTVATLAAPEITGFAGSSGWPSATAVGGTALAATLLSSVMARRGRRAGIVLGISIAVVGGALAILAVVAGSILLLLLALAAVGFGNAAMNLSRYAAADMYPPERRAGALGVVVWGGTIGAVLGPNLVGPAGALAPSLGLSALAGGFALALVFLVAALLVAFLGPSAPSQPHLDEPKRPAGTRATPARRLLAELMRRPRGRTAVIALVISQLVMTLVMAMTPYHLRSMDHGLETVGLVISAHTFGMFAFSPLSGRLTDRFGATAMVLVGFAVLASSGLMAAVIPDSGAILAVPLFLLGVGWNLGFVAGSSLLTAEAPVGDRARLQGASDALVWTVAAVASLSAGYVVAAASYASLSLVAAALAVVLGGAIVADTRRSRSAPA